MWDLGFNIIQAHKQLFCLLCVFGSVVTHHAPELEDQWDSSIIIIECLRELFICSALRVYVAENHIYAYVHNLKWGPWQSHDWALTQALVI